MKTTLGGGARRIRERLADRAQGLRVGRREKRRLEGRLPLQSRALPAGFEPAPPRAPPRVTAASRQPRRRGSTGRMLPCARRLCDPAHGSVTYILLELERRVKPPRDVARGLDARVGA